MKQITLFKDGEDQWAAKFRFADLVDVDVCVTKLSEGYVTSINVVRADYPGMVLCNALDRYDVVIKADQSSGAASIIDRNHLKLATKGRPIQLTIYKFDFGLEYEGS